MVINTPTISCDTPISVECTLLLQSSTRLQFYSFVVNSKKYIATDMILHGLYNAV